MHYNKDIVDDSKHMFECENSIERNDKRNGKYLKESKQYRVVVHDMTREQRKTPKNNTELGKEIREFDKTWGNQHYIPKALKEYLKERRVREIEETIEKLHKIHVEKC